MPTFDPARARSFAALLARPRGCGSAEEREAAGRVREAFRDAGLETEEEFFHFRPSGDRTVRTFLVAGLASLAAVYAGAVWQPWAAVAGFAALAALALWGPALSRRLLLSRARNAREPETPAPGWIRTSNVVGRAPGPAGSPLLVFVAHYDSKSQNLPITARIACFLLLAAAGLPLAELSLLRILLGTPGPAVLTTLAAATLAAALPLLALRTGNASPGALDNASGVGTLVEVARLWRASPLSSRARAVFLAPSAEEHGLIGSWLWVKRHFADLRGELRLRVLNLDSIGARGRWLVLPGRGPVADAFMEGAAAAGLRARRVPLGIGLLADHVPFVQSGFPCATLLAHAPGTRSIHTPRDSADLLDDAAFEEAGKLVLGAVERLVR